MSNDELVDAGARSRGSLARSARLQFIAHGIAWAICLGFFVFGILGIESILNDENIPLPRAAVFVIWAAHQVIALTVSILVLLGLDWFALELLSRRSEIEVSQTWSTLVFATPMVLIALVLIALSLPFFMIDFGLSG
jgi:hypothetical protein